MSDRFTPLSTVRLTCSFSPVAFLACDLSPETNNGSAVQRQRRRGRWGVGGGRADEAPR